MYWKVNDITAAHVASFNGESIADSILAENVPPFHSSMDNAAEPSSTALSATSSIAFYPQRSPTENFSRAEEINHQMKMGKILIASPRTGSIW